jgi:hypothetical protein
MATYYFKVGTGEPFTDKTDAGDDAVARGHAVKVTNAPDNVESWRMTYNFGTSSVDVYEASMSNEDAQVARKAALDKKDADESKSAKDAQVALDAADA